MPTRRTCLLLALSIPLLPILAQAPVPTNQLRAEHQHILEELNVRNANDQVMELDDDRLPPLLQRGWQLAGAWAAGYIEAHPAVSNRALDRIFEDFAPKPRSAKSPLGDFFVQTDYSLQGSAFRIAPSVYVVEASYGVDFRTGTFMVVARNQLGHLQALWNIKDLAEKHYPQRDEIGRWMFLVRRSYYSGPLVVSKVLALPPAANGHARFLIDAYQSADGGTVLAQLSIWEWDGAQANPLLVEPYEYAMDTDGGFHFDGRTLRISTKEPLDTLFSCGMCAEPRGVWTLRITPTGVDNLGRRLRQPEIQWADELLSKLGKGQDVTDLAAPQVRDAIQARVHAEPNFSWGMLAQCRRVQRRAFLLILDEGQLRFRYTLRAGRPYFTAVEINEP